MVFHAKCSQTRSFTKLQLFELDSFMSHDILISHTLLLNVSLMCTWKQYLHFTGYVHFLLVLLTFHVSCLNKSFFPKHFDVHSLNLIHKMGSIEIT